jgi:hypothetical protein
MAMQPTVVLNAALPKTVDTGSGIGWFRRIGELAMAPNLMQCQAFRQRQRLSRSQGRSIRSAAEGVERMGEGGRAGRFPYWAACRISRRGHGLVGGA